MGSSDKHQCKLCGNETYKIFAYTHEIFAYTHTFAEVIPFKIYEDGKWKEIELRICQNCGHIQGETFIDEMEQQ